MNQVISKATDVAIEKSHFSLNTIVDLQLYPIDQDAFRVHCKHTFEKQGVLVLPSFLTADAVRHVAREGDTSHDKAYYTQNNHNIYLKPTDPEFDADHPRNRLVSSSKGCITTDQIPSDSILRTLYDNSTFIAFLCEVLDENALFEYADPLSSINLHYAAHGQELGWHFDNSSFAITLLIQKPEAGGVFEYVQNVRDADRGEMSYEQAGRILDGNLPAKTLCMDAGALVLFRGRNSLHRVTPTQGDVTRMLVVLAYNTEPDIALSESARMTFYGRLG